MDSIIITSLLPPCTPSYANPTQSPLLHWLHDLSGKGNKQGLEHDDLEQEMLPAHREVIHPDPGTREGVTDTGTCRN